MMVGGAITIWKNDGVCQWEELSHIQVSWKIKNVPNHQPESHEDPIQIPFKSWQLRFALS